jgi:hypothetical protein
MALKHLAVDARPFQQALSLVAVPVEASPQSPVSFEELGVDVCIDGGALGDVWLVPEITGRARVEVTPKVVALLEQVLSAIPGARLAGLWKHWPPFESRWTKSRPR